MKKTMKFLCMTALVLVGAVMTGCSNDDDSVVDNKKVVTLTTTIGFEDSLALTRALTAGGVKTFAAGEKLALKYHNGSSWVVAESKALQSTDIADGNKLAKFTFTLTDPTNADVTYIYPASMANSDGSVKDDALETQDGTLTSIASNLDLATLTKSWDGSNLPTGTLTNQLAILAITLKNADGSSEITNRIETLTINDTYTVNRTPAAGPIYVAIRPTTTINVTASDGTNNYSKTLTGKDYAAGKGYNVTWRMNPAPAN